MVTRCRSYVCCIFKQNASELEKNHRLDSWVKLSSDSALFVLEIPLLVKVRNIQIPLFRTSGAPELPREMSQARHACPFVKSSGWLSRGSVHVLTFHISRRSVGRDRGEQRDARLSVSVSDVCLNLGSDENL